MLLVVDGVSDDMIVVVLVIADDGLSQRFFATGYGSLHGGWPPPVGQGRLSRAVVAIWLCHVH